MDLKGPVNEKELIAASKKDLQFFKPVYEFYYPRILDFIYHRTNEINDAADIASVVFYKALANLNRYKDLDLPFGAWLFKIAYNELMQHFRKSKKTRFIVLDESLIENLAEDIKTDNRETLLKAAVKAADNLKPPELEIIDMKYFQQKTNREIAFILGIREGNLKVRVHRIIRKLQKLITEIDDAI